MTFHQDFAMARIRAPKPLDGVSEDVTVGAVRERNRRGRVLAARGI